MSEECAPVPNGEVHKAIPDTETRQSSYLDIEGQVLEESSERVESICLWGEERERADHCRLLVNCLLELFNSTTEANVPLIKMEIVRNHRKGTWQGSGRKGCVFYSWGCLVSVWGQMPRCTAPS
jgi:hypothetical protein